MTTVPVHARTVVLLDVDGEVLAWREGWRKWEQVSAGVELKLDDLVDVKAGASVLAICPDGVNLWRIGPGLAGMSNGCAQAPGKPLIRAGQKVVAPRVSPGSDFVLRPRGLIRDAGPLLDWTDFGASETYEIRVVSTGESMEVVWGPALVEGSEYRYSTSASVHQLDPEREYFLEVKNAGGGTFYRSGKSFRIMDRERSRAVAVKLRGLRRSIGRGIERSLATAVILAREELYAEAFEKIGQIDRIDRDAQTAAVVLLSARLLEEIGLKEKAFNFFEEALVRAQEEESHLVAGHAAEGAARTVYDQEEEERFYTVAYGHWTDLGDVEGIDRVCEFFRGEKLKKMAPMCREGSLRRGVSLIFASPRCSESSRISLGTLDLHV